MKIHNLHIERKPSYDSEFANMLVGTVQIQGEHGKLEVRLSSKAMTGIFALIKEDVQRVADYNASQVSQAVEEAEHETELLLETLP